MAEEHINAEEQLISLFINDRDNVKRWDVSGIGVNFFDEKHQNLLSGVKYAFNNDVTLTRQTYTQFLKDYKKLTPQDVAAEVSVYNRCSMRASKKDDLPSLLDVVKGAFIRRKTTLHLNDYRKEREKLGDLGANRALIEKLAALEADTIESKAQWLEIHKAKNNFMEKLYERRNNPNVRLTCGIPEIDDTMNVGFKKGHLTLFCADVGSFKTTMMVNVALNLFKLSQQKSNILYIPLEMPADEILQKIVARETQIPFSLIEHAEQLSEEQIKMISDEMDRWSNLQHSFSILEMAERTKVSTIRREIEKRITYFQPRVVFVDYADNLIPDLSRGNRSDLEMNDMLEDMRKMGKALGFSVVSAAQLARDALKKVREQKEDKQQLGSTDIRGGQVMTANSDTVYAQLRDPAMPNEKLIFFCIKARHGKNTFSNNRTKTTLQVRADIGLIESPNAIHWGGNANDPLALGLNSIGQDVAPPEEDDPFQ